MRHGYSIVVYCCSVVGATAACEVVVIIWQAFVRPQMAAVGQFDCFRQGRWRGHLAERRTKWNDIWPESEICGSAGVLYFRCPLRLESTKR